MDNIEKVTISITGAKFTLVRLPAGYGCEEFWLAETHTTVDQWNAVMEDRRAEPNDWPVTGVSFVDALLFCKKLSEAAGVEFTIPTDAQFCRALGVEPEHLADYAVFGQTSCGEVKTKRPNEYGLYDMRGLAWHWLARKKYRKEQSQYLRGGAWLGVHFRARAVSRFINPPAVRNLNVGFRVCCVVRPGE